MSQILNLPDDLYRKLCKGAAERGLTIEGLLTFVSELVVTPDRPTERDRKRSLRIERLFTRYCAGRLTARDRTELEELIDADYQEAGARADRLIAAKKPRQNTSQSVGGAKEAMDLSTKPSSGSWN
jgi:hypothetical protein